VQVPHLFAEPDDAQRPGSTAVTDKQTRPGLDRQHARIRALPYLRKTGAKKVIYHGG
jgi:hypothetical protein